jgi:hypothetical protein
VNGPSRRSVISVADDDPERHSPVDERRGVADQVTVPRTLNCGVITEYVLRTV